MEGKLGGVVLYEVDGVTSAREAVKDIKKKPTDLQLYYRSKFILTSAFLRPIKKVVDFGFQNFSKGMRKGTLPPAKQSKTPSPEAWKTTFGSLRVSS